MLNVLPVKNIPEPKIMGKNVVQTPAMKGKNYCKQVNAWIAHLILGLQKTKRSAEMTFAVMFKNWQRVESVKVVRSLRDHRVKIIKFVRKTIVLMYKNFQNQVNVAIVPNSLELVKMVRNVFLQHAWKEKSCSMMELVDNVQILQGDKVIKERNVDLISVMIGNS